MPCHLLLTTHHLAHQDPFSVLFGNMANGNSSGMGGMGGMGGAGGRPGGGMHFQFQQMGSTASS